jgi:hypothetical protein
MNEPSNSTDDLDILYKEYVRLNARLDTIIDGSWADFKLLGAIGALIAWPPLAQSNLFSTSDLALALFVGFVGILFVIVVLGMRDLIKQSVMQHYMFELQLQEEAIRARLQHDTPQSFHLADHWLGHRVRTWRGIVSRFYLSFYLFLFAFPVGVLIAVNAWPYAVGYGVAMLISLGIYLSAAKLLDNWQKISE